MVLGPVAGICIFFAHKLFLLNFICSSKEIQKAGGERHPGSLSFRFHGKKIRPKTAIGSPILSGGFNFTREHAIYVVASNTYTAHIRVSLPVKRSRIFLKLFQIASNPSGNSHLIFRRFPLYVCIISPANTHDSAFHILLVCGKIYAGNEVSGCIDNDWGML